MRNKIKYKRKLSAISHQLLAIGFLFILGSCNKSSPVCECFESAGSQSSLVVQVPYFNQIAVKDNINVVITQGSPEQVTIEGGKNLIQNIGTSVSGVVLDLKNNNICNWLRSYKKSVINVYITMPELVSVTNSGYGTVQSQGTIVSDSLVLNTNNSSGDIQLDVNARFINAHLFGTADLTLSGQSLIFLCDFFGGTGFIYDKNLTVTGYAFLSTNTTGDCYINCNNSLIVTIYGEGNVYYSGNPVSLQYTSEGGSGSLIKD